MDFWIEALGFVNSEIVKSIIVHLACSWKRR